MPEQKKGRLEILRGSIFLKIIVLVGLGLIVSVFLFGMPITLTDLIWNGLRILLGIILVVFVIKGIQSVFKQKPFSPTESFRKKIIRVAKLSKPFNVKQLYIRGEDMRIYSKWGKITGLCFIPYISSKPLLDKSGSIIYEEKKEPNGKIAKDSEGKIIMIPKREMLTEKDGDWVFVIQTGIIPVFGREELVRAHHKLCSPIGERVWIKTPNLVPIGEYFYPCQQWQEDIIQIVTQHKAEALVETHEQFLDLMSHVTQISLGSDPTLQKILLAQSESLSSQQSGVLIGGGGGG